MMGGIQDRLHAFATTLLERQGGLVEWPTTAGEGTAVLTREMSETLHIDSDMVRLSGELGGAGLCVNLATDFLEKAAGLLAAEPRVGVFRVAELYLKRGDMNDAVRRAFTWLNAKVTLAEARGARVEYHTWWFRASIHSEDRWETRFPVTVNAASGIEVPLPDPLGLWELQPGRAAGGRARSTHDLAIGLARARVKDLAADFVGRMDSRLERDRRRLHEYYGTLLREAKGKKPRGAVKVDPEKLEAKKHAVKLELRRKLSELDERYAMEIVLAPIVLVRTEIPVLALDLRVFRKQARKLHTVFWNPILKRFEPLRCAGCGAGVFAVAFTNDDVQPLCGPCAHLSG